MTNDKQSTETSTPAVTKTATEDGSDGKAKKNGPHWSKSKKKKKSTSLSTTVQKKSTSKFKGTTEGIEEHTFTYMILK